MTVICVLMWDAGTFLLYAQDEFLLRDNKDQSINRSLISAVSGAGTHTNYTPSDSYINRPNSFPLAHSCFRVSRAGSLSQAFMVLPETDRTSHIASTELEQMLRLLLQERSHHGSRTADQHIRLDWRFVGNRFSSRHPAADCSWASRGAYAGLAGSSTHAPLMWPICGFLSSTSEGNQGSNRQSHCL